MLMHAQPDEAHAQQYQHTQNQMTLAQKEREKQYFQAKNVQAAAGQAVGQQPRFGDAGNTSNFGRNPSFGQQQAGGAGNTNPSQAGMQNFVASVRAAVYDEIRLHVALQRGMEAIDGNQKAAQSTSQSATEAPR